MFLRPSLMIAVFILAGLVFCAPAVTISSTSTAASSTPTIPYISTDPNESLWTEDSDPSIVQPQRGKLGAPFLRPAPAENIAIDLQNPDLLAPPSTDSGELANAKWPFSLSHTRLQTGGWVREQTVAVMPIATSIAGANMRLEAGSIRELHWHTTSEWAYVLKGSTQISAVDGEGRNYVATVGPGDLWYFPAGVPHSLQATGDDDGGSEFLLIFDDGNFGEDTTFSLIDWLDHIPAEGVLLEKNFQVDASAFAHVPGKELYIFPSTTPEDDALPPESPQGTVPLPYSFASSKANVTQTSGGSYKVVDSSTFQISTTIAMVEVTVEPGAMRELHWHPTQDEWSYFIEGEGRVTIFAARGRARTFNYQSGDKDYWPHVDLGHYVENTGNTTLAYIELFKSDRFEDVSLSQWLALTPPHIVKAHLNVDDETIALMSKTKPVVIGPS
ncbi:oxalate oxidase [Guyanagaster necrorhizus]|uniref:Oxalate oxidase n=1 Tax=Guyanagaster necrorhizus TaxID=856835 RepID=A0A9P7VNC6_9AGAR|nr:oxalate oxidase [Guyanagaster necrorhizus MCA 3950]KAG7443505.1 oxalate oxidase [Guyanagaster necrorhizus MCA 3950]